MEHKNFKTLLPHAYQRMQEDTWISSFPYVYKTTKLISRVSLSVTLSYGKQCLYEIREVTVWT